MERAQLIRILALDSNNIRLSNLGRLMPPENAVCIGLSYSLNINKLDCKNCILYNPIAATRYFNVVKVDVSDVKPKRSNITGRYMCPKCINKSIDSIDEDFYFKRNFNFILDLYDRLLTMSVLEYNNDGIE